MTGAIPPICLYCKHYRPKALNFECAAFPDGIPEAIIESGADHRQPFDGDHGIQFEPKSKAGAVYAEQVFAEART